MTGKIFYTYSIRGRHDVHGQPSTLVLKKYVYHQRDYKEIRIS